MNKQASNILLKMMAVFFIVTFGYSNTSNALIVKCSSIVSGSDPVVQKICVNGDTGHIHNWTLAKAMSHNGSYFHNSYRPQDYYKLSIKKLNNNEIEVSCRWLIVQENKECYCKLNENTLGLSERPNNVTTGEKGEWVNVAKQNTTTRAYGGAFPLSDTCAGMYKKIQ